MTAKVSQRMRRRRSFILSVAFGLLLGATGGSALAEDMPDASPQGAGIQAASWVLTIPYGAVKSVYAIGGGIVGSRAWVVTGEVMMWQSPSGSLR